MKIAVRLALSVACISLVSLGQAHTVAPQKAPAKFVGMDKTFAVKAMQLSLGEVMLGQLAQKNAGSNGVKQYGMMMMQDHGMSRDELRNMATHRKMKLPTKTDAEHMSAYRSLSRMKGRAFDSAYAKLMVAGHTKAVALFTKASRQCKDTELRNWAASTLGVLHRHLSMARSLQSGKMHMR